MARRSSAAAASASASQRGHATITLAKDESESTAVRQLLQQTAFAGQLLALDALHLQHETVQQILDACGADYLLPLKGNQPTILATARTLLPETLSPSGSV